MSLQSHKTPTLKAALYDGMFFAAMIGLGEAYVAPFGLAAGLDASAIVLLGTLPSLVGAISQLIGVYLCEQGNGRKKWIVLFSGLQAIVLLFLSAAAIYATFNINIVKVLIFPIIFTYFIFGHITGPLWNSLIGDLVPSDSRGVYFGFRNRWMGVIQVLAMISSGVTLYFGKLSHLELYAFAALFLFASFARMASTFYLNKYEDPPLQQSSSDYFSFWDFIRRAPKSNFAKYAIFTSALALVHALSGSLFSVYMIRDMHLDYISFTILATTPSTAQLFFIPHWGRLADKFGNVRVLHFASVGLSLCPLWWLISDSLWWLILVQIYAGFVWAGFIIATGNFLFDAVTPAKRARCAAYFTIVNTTGAACGGLISREIISYLELSQITFTGFQTVSSPLLLLFFISGIGRLLVCATLGYNFTEVRNVESTTRKEFLYTTLGFKRAMN